MQPYPEQLLGARAFAVQCFYSSRRVMPEAVRRFEWGWNRLRVHKVSDVRSFILQSVEAFEAPLLTKAGESSTAAEHTTACGVGDNLLHGYLPAGMQANQAYGIPCIPHDSPRVHDTSLTHTDLHHDCMVLPSRSVDINQPIEHCFGDVKHHVYAERYRLG